MRRASLVALALAAGGCLDFNGLIEACMRKEGPCAPPGIVPIDGGYCHSEWCWETPFPHGETLNAVWGSRPSDVWVGGGAGMLMHWDGVAWTFHQGEAGDASIEGLYGVSANDVWAVGGGVHRYNGTWSVDGIPGTRLHAIAGTSEEDIWAVGDLGVLAHSDGGGWTTQPIFPTTHYGASITADDVGTCWVALNGNSSGTNGYLARCDGTLGDFDAGDDALRGIWSSGRGNVWLAQDTHRLLHYDGGVVNEVQFGLGLEGSLHGGAFFDDDDSNFIAVGERNLAYEPGPGGYRLPLVATVEQVFRAVWGSASNDVWAVGEMGALAHRNGAEWKTLQAGHVGALYGLELSGSELHAFGTVSSLLTRRGEWVLDGVPVGSSESVFRAWFTASNGFAVGDHGSVFSSDGGAWTVETLPDGAELFGVWGTSPTNLWVTGRRSGDPATVWHRTAAGWMPISLGGSAPPFKVHGADATHAWIGGDNGSIWELTQDGGTWQLATRSTCQQASFSGVWAVGPDKAWVVGSSATICRLEGGMWVDDPAGITVDGALLDVWGFDEGLLFAVGDDGLVLKREGGRWTRIEIPTQGRLEGVRGLRNPDGGYDLWVAGGSGILHRRFP